MRRCWRMAASRRAVALPIAPRGSERRGSSSTSSAARPSARSPTRARDHALFEVFNGGPPGPELQASDDGEHWRTIVQVPGDGAAQHTLSFPAVTARYFRALFVTPPPRAAGARRLRFLGARDHAAAARNGLPRVGTARSSRARASSGPRRRPASAMLRGSVDARRRRPCPQALAIRSDAVIDLTAKLRADGTLDWTPPPGRWRVLRFGYSLTGVTNHPASPEGTGLEVDKLSAAHVRDYMTHYLDLYERGVGRPDGPARPHAARSATATRRARRTGPRNCSPSSRRRRGYDPQPWLPTLTGRVVESAAASDRFLWDYRRTLADLIAENHYEQITESAARARHGALRRVARVGPRVHRRRHGGQAQQRRADGGDVDAASRRERRPARLQRRHPRIGLGRAHLRPEPGRGRIADRRQRPPGSGRRRRSSPPPTRNWRWA